MTRNNNYDNNATITTITGPPSRLHLLLSWDTLVLTFMCPWKDTKRNSTVYHPKFRQFTQGVNTSPSDTEEKQPKNKIPFKILKVSKIGQTQSAKVITEMGFLCTPLSNKTFKIGITKVMRNLHQLHSCPGNPTRSVPAVSSKCERTCADVDRDWQGFLEKNKGRDASTILEDFAKFRWGVLLTVHPSYYTPPWQNGLKSNSYTKANWSRPLLSRQPQETKKNFLFIPYIASTLPLPDWKDLHMLERHSYKR